MSYLECREISKSFPGVKALQNVSFKVEAGSVHGLVGENGAGKSTLMKVLGGSYSPDSGSLWLDGKQQHFTWSRDAIQQGIAIIHQELQYIPELSVTENLLLGYLPHKLGFVQKHEARRWVKQKFQEVGVDINPDAKLNELSIAEQQMVEICKAIFRDAKVLALDEPTSSLSLKETEILFRIINQLKKQNKALIYISHRLDEIFKICDAVTVLRDGQLVSTHSEMQGLTRDQLVQEMVGRKITDIFNYSPRTKGPVCLTVRGLRGSKLKAPVNLEVCGGEIVGFFGLVGAGRSELMRLIYGADKAEVNLAGKADDGPANVVSLNGNPLHLGIKAAIAEGLFFCPEDRKKDGVVDCRSVLENINISCRRHSKRWGFFTNNRAEKEAANNFIKKLKIRTPDCFQLVKHLSGGNQQKVILSRWLAEKSVKVLIVDEPTRGIDVGAKYEIYQVLYALAAQGTAILMVSSELPEVLGVSDRIIVMRGGEIAGELKRSEASETAVLRLALPDALKGRPVPIMGDSQATPLPV